MRSPHRPRCPEGRPRQGRQAPSPCTRRRRRRTRALVALPRRQMLVGRGPLLPSPARVSHLPSVTVLFFLFFLNLDLGLASSPSRYLDFPSVDPEDIDTVIEDVAKDAAAEAEKIAAEETAKGAAEDAAKGPAREPGKATAEEAGKGPAGEAGKAAAEEEVVDDQPSSSAASGSGKYLKVSDDLFVHLPGTANTGAPVEGGV